MFYFPTNCRFYLQCLHLYCGALQSWSKDLTFLQWWWQSRNWYDLPCWNNRFNTTLPKREKWVRKVFSMLVKWHVLSFLRSFKSDFYQDQNSEKYQKIIWDVNTYLKMLPHPLNDALVIRNSNIKLSFRLTLYLTISISDIWYVWVYWTFSYDES